jgi:alkanesulfonate monooxygenase SsuD/methylene tetrahydromethanopterin reductase-like flavin-dependent oxidoreductase (luciferase family)
MTLQREKSVSNKLTFGYLYDFRNPPQWHKPWHTLYGEILDAVAWTEEAGFYGAWVPEHHLADDGYMPSPLVALSAIAARTKRIKLGSGIALAPLYHPTRFAEDSAVLDIISGGRLEMGLAIGYRRRETAAFGVDFGKRGRLFDEWLEIVSRLWAGETVDFEGQYFRIKGAKVMPPPPRGRIPLYIGGFAGKAMERVAQYGDGYIGSPDVCDLYVEKLREHGKDLSQAKVRITALFVVAAHDPEKAMEELAPYYHHVNNSYGEWFYEDKALGLEDGSAMKPMSLDAFKKSGTLQILTPKAAVAMFKAMQERMPLDHVMMMMPPGLPAARFVEYAQVFANEVIPAFR